MIATSSVSIINVDDGQAYALQPSNSVIIMEEDGDYKPSQLSFQSLKLTGTSEPSSYSGRFKIERTSDETNWTTEYTSSSDESSTTYTIPSTIEEKTPYNFRVTGNGNNVGSKAFDTIVGGTVAWNQLVQNGNFADTSGWNVNGSASLSAENNVLTVTMNANATNSTYIANSSIKRSTINHVYMYGFSVKPSRQTKVWMSYSAKFGNTRGHVCSANQWADCAGVIKSLADNTAFSIYISDPATILQGDTLSFKNYNIFDLTQMFGSTIADYIYSLEQANAGAGVAWFRKLFPKPYYAYNAGELMSVQTSSHDTIGFNAWDEEWQNGYYGTTGVFIPNASYVACKNKIPVLPNTQYCFSSQSKNIGRLCFYDADENFVSTTIGIGQTATIYVFTTPSVVHYMVFDMTSNYGNTYKNDVCINLSWDGERNGEYEPYIKHSYPLDSDLVLRGIPKLDASNNLYYDGDEYLPDGTVTRRYGVVDMGTLTWIRQADGCFYANISNKTQTSESVNLVCGKYTAYIQNATDVSIFNYISDKTITGIKRTTSGANSWIYVKDTSYTDAATFKTAMSGVYLVYELATPTTEIAEPYVSPQIVDRYGTEEYVTDGIVPVGHETKYTSNIFSIRCSLYASGGTTTLLDQQIIPVINDAESAVYMTKQIEEYRLSDSSTSITGSGDGYEWADTMPEVPPGKYIWGRIKSYFSNGSIAYSDAICDIVMSGLVFDVDRNTNAITSKVWESDITTKINQYDGSTGATIRDRVSQTETNISGITSRVSDVESETDSLGTRMTSAESSITQNADNIALMVTVDGTSSSLTLTQNMLTAMTSQFVVKDPAGSATIISGGKIHANAITTAMLAANAIKSTNYSSGTSGSDVPANNYSTSGTFLDLTTGNIYTPNFAVNSVNGEAYLNGTIYASAGQIGNPGDAYWSIGTVYDSTWGDYAGLIANGNALIQSGKLTLSSDRLNSQNAGNYIQSGGYWYDFGLQVPDFTAGTNSHDQNFLYVRRIGHQPTDSTLDTDWSYLFRVDKSGNIYWNGHDISDGTFLPLSGGTVTGATTFGSTLTVNGKLTASSAIQTNIMLQTNLGSTSAGQLTGNTNATVTHGVTGTLGVGNGGTGKSSWTANRLIYSSASNALSEFAAGTSGQILKSNGSSAPSWVNQSTLSVGSATKATQDGDGNIITDTYRALDNNQFDTIDIIDAEVGNLIVKGAARFTNGLYGTASEASKVTNALTIQLNGGTTEGTNQFTYDGSAVKNINITRSSIGLGAAADKAVDTSIAASSSSTNLPTSAAVASFVEGKGYVTSSGVTSVRVQATSPVVSSVNTAQSSTLNTTISLADSYGDTKNPYGTKTANYVLAGPSSGSAVAPAFRKLVAADIPSLTKSKISDFPTTWALTDITGADDLKAIEGLTGASGILKKTAANTWALSTVISGLSINNDVLTVTKSDGTTQDLTINITGQVVSGATILSDASGNPISEGSTSKPVYFSNGIPVSANTIPTIVLNGSNTTSPSFYAPTGAGTSGQYLKSNGSGAPTWATFSKSTVGLGNVDNTADANKNVLTATKFAAAQSVTLTGDTTGTASSQAGWSIETKTDRLSTTGDNRSMATDPDDYVNKIIFQGLKNNNDIGSPSTDRYSYVVGLRGWENSSGGDSHELAFNNSGISRRSGGTAWGSWVKLIDSGNYTNYTVTKSGTGATGTWGINISGTATNATYAKYLGFQSINELRFDINTKPSSDTYLHVGYKWSDGSTDAKINRYIFYNGGGAGALAGVQASTFYGDLSGNATSATKATQDSDGNAINSTYMKKSGGAFTGAVTGTSFAASSYIAVNSGNSGTAGGLALYGTTPTTYGIAMRQTANGGKHGYVQGDWGIYSYMTGADNRGWILKNASTAVGVASVSNVGHAVFNGSVTIGGNTTNTSGCRQEFDADLQCLNFIFN